MVHGDDDGDGAPDEHPLLSALVAPSALSVFVNSDGARAMLIDEDRGANGTVLGGLEAAFAVAATKAARCLWRWLADRAASFSVANADVESLAAAKRRQAPFPTSSEECAAFIYDTLGSRSVFLRHGWPDLGVNLVLCGEALAPGPKRRHRAQMTIWYERGNKQWSQQHSESAYSQFMLASASAGVQRARERRRTRAFPAVLAKALLTRTINTTSGDGTAACFNQRVRNHLWSGTGARRSWRRRHQDLLARRSYPGAKPEPVARTVANVPLYPVPVSWVIGFVTGPWTGIKKMDQAPFAATVRAAAAMLSPGSVDVIPELFTSKRNCVRPELAVTVKSPVALTVARGRAKGSDHLLHQGQATKLMRYSAVHGVLVDASTTPHTDYQAVYRRAGTCRPEAAVDPDAARTAQADPLSRPTYFHRDRMAALNMLVIHLARLAGLVRPDAFCFQTARSVRWWQLKSGPRHILCRPLSATPGATPVPTPVPN